MKLCEMIKAARYKKGLSLSGLQTATGIKNSLLSYIENGKMRAPSFYKIVKIAAALDLKLDDLANTELDSGCSQKLRDSRAKIARRTWRDPKARERITEGQRAATTKWAKRATMAEKKYRYEKGQETMRAHAEAE